MSVDHPPGPEFGWAADGVCDRFEAACKGGERPRIEDYLGDSAGGGRGALLRELLIVELCYRGRRGESLVREDYLERFPEHGPLIDQAFAAADRTPQALPGVADTLDLPAGSGAPPDVPAMGLELLDKFQFLRQLGKGGMGEVWLAHQKSLGREVALKLISPRVAYDTDSRARFRREALAMAAISHRNAVVVHQVEIPEGGTPYIVMEHIPGKSLDKVLRKGIPMPIEWIAEVLAQLCDVLQVAHGRGIVHRDLKPSNMILVEEKDGAERLKVFDFGVAKILGDGDARVTSAGDSIGTPAYMSPEQARGDSSRVDHRCDIYTVGVILYEFLCGFLPYEGDAVGIRACHGGMDILPPPFEEKNREVNVPAAVEDLVRSCLAKDPGSRPGSARELAEKFREAISGEARPAAEPVVLGEPKEAALAVAAGKIRRPSRRVVLGLIVSATFLGVGTAVAEYWMNRGRPPHPPDGAGPLMVKVSRLGGGSVDLALDRGGAVVKMTLVRVPPDDRYAHVPFEMEIDDNDRISGKISPVYFARTETTRAQYDLVMGRAPLPDRMNWDLPATGVSWGDAVEFCRRLQEALAPQLVGSVVRLPKEIEWEFAVTCAHGLLSNSVESLALAKDPRPVPYPVGLESPSRWGVCGLSSNVDEWTGDSIEGASDERAVRAGPLDGPSRNRALVENSARKSSLGFRIVAHVPATSE